MLKSELETAMERPFADEVYELINTVYMYYPGIEDKQQVYALLQQFGMTLFNDLYPRAKRLAELSDKIHKLEKEIATLKEGSAFSA